MSEDAGLREIFDADRAARQAELALLSEAPATLRPRLARAVADARELDDSEEADLRLRRLADLCAQVPGPETIAALLAILDHRTPSIRTEAGEALLDVAFRRFKEVAQAVEGLLDSAHDGASMEELPFVLTEVRDPDPVPLVGRFLAHPSASVVAASIEALAAFGDAAAVAALEEYVDDEREATLDDLDDARATIGELAQAAILELEGEGEPIAS